MIGRTNKETGETWAYIYDARNCMTEVQKNGSTVAHYVYDPEGNRIKALYLQEDGSPEGGTNDGIYYHYDYTGLLTENPIVEEPVPVSGPDDPKRNFIFLNRKLFARVDGDIGSGEKYWYMTDHLGSAHGLMNLGGEMVWWADYEAFGKAKGVGGPEGEAAVNEVPRFTGKAWDEKVGLYYFNARWYDPELGRFLAEDIAKDDLNLYKYCRNNPLVCTDPTGLATYFVIYYDNPYSDSDGSFLKAAETWKEGIENSEDYDPENDTIIIIGVTTEEDFISAMDSIYEITEQRIEEGGEEQKIQAGAIFSHGSEVGLHFAGSSLYHDEIKDLKKLQWMENGLLQLKGCNTAMEANGVSTAQVFAESQQCFVSGQRGNSYFSTDPFNYHRVNSESSEVYLQAFARGSNLSNKLFAILYWPFEDGAEVIYEYTFNPSGGSVNYSPLVPVNGFPSGWF